MGSLIEQHAHHSILRERIVEHWLVSELMRQLWIAGRTDIEILRSEFDRGGYDLMLDLGGVTRHLQLKTSRKGGTSNEVTLSLELARRQSGCVVWIVVDDDLLVDHFRWLGGAPGEPLGDISALKVAKQTRANADGIKNEKVNFRRASAAKFEKIWDVAGLLDKLFSSAWRPMGEPTVSESH